MKFDKQKLAGFLLLFSIILISNASNPPNGKTGAPGENSCAQSGCHTGGNGNLDGDITISGLPTTITAGATYQISVTVDNPNGVANRAGFQWVALDGSNSNAGSIANPSANSNTAMMGGRAYHEHGPASIFDATNEISWTADWTAPAGPDGETITIYGVGNIANGATANGDRIRQTTASGTLSVLLSATIIDSMNVSCAFVKDGSATVEAAGGTPPYSFLWDSGEDTATAVELLYGTRYVTVTDAALDTAIDSVMISQPDFLNGMLDTIIDATCGMDNGSIVVSAVGGNPPYEFNWSDGQTGIIATDLAPGQYFCSVTDASMCETVFGGFLNAIGAIPTITELDLQLIQCSNSTMGALIEVAGANGIPPYDYAWSHGDMDSIAQNLGSGLYTVSVTDAVGCEVTMEWDITIPSELVLEMSNVTHASCFGAEDGICWPVTLGGAAPVETYAWSDGSANDSLINVGAGTYYLTVTSFNGCIAIDSVTILEAPELFTNIGSTNDDSSAAPTGAAFVSASGGAGGYGYVWQNGAITDTIFNLFSGVYYVTVTDADNCSVIDSIIVSPANCDLEAVADISHISCADLDDGSISVGYNNSFDPLNIIWSNGSTDPSISNLSEGLYSMTVSDAAFCIDTLMDLEIINPDTLRLLNNVIQAPLCLGDSTTLLSTSIIGGTAPFSASWSTGSMMDTLSMIPAGLYSVTITDDRGCLDSLSFDISNTDTEGPTALLVDTAFMYLDSMGMTTALIASDFDLGSNDLCGIDTINFISSIYSCTDLGISHEIAIELIDLSGLITLDTFTLSVLDTIAPTITCLNDITLTNCDTLQFNLPVAMDNCLAEVIQVSGPTPGSFPEAGMHLAVFEAIDNAGNKSVCSFTITVDTILNINSTVENVSCFELTDGCVTFDISGGVTPYSINFDDANLENCVNLPAGSHSLTIADDNGCVVHDTVVITQPDNFTIVLSAIVITDATNSNSMDGAIDIDPPLGGTMPYMYEWFLNGALVATTEDINNLAPGSYNLTITDANNCTIIIENTIVDAITGVEDLAFAEWITMQPNPAVDQVYISLDYQGKFISQVSLMDMTGAEVLQKTVNASAYELNLEQATPGIYLVKIQVDNQTISKKLILR